MNESDQGTQPDLVVRSNARVGWALALSGAAVVAGAMVWLLEAPGVLGQVAAGTVAGLGACWCWLGVWFLITPAVVGRTGELWVRLAPAHSVRIPLEHVEAFLLQPGPALPWLGDRVRAACLVVRLAEKAQPWSQQRRATWMAIWCGPYITLRGTWLEPLCVEKVHDWNAQLAQLQRQTHPCQASSEQPTSAAAP